MKDRFMKTNKKSGFTTEYNITHTIPDDYSDIGTQEWSSVTFRDTSSNVNCSRVECPAQTDLETIICFRNSDTHRK